MGSVGYLGDMLEIDGERHAVPYPVVDAFDLGLVVVVRYDPNVGPLLHSFTCRMYPRTGVILSKVFTK